MSANGFQGYNVDRSLTSGAVEAETSNYDRGADIGTVFSDKKSTSLFNSATFEDGDSKKSHEDLKIMLDSNKDNLKLEAMKRIIAMVAKGSDCSDLFPAVVKNVVAKNAEVKKLVYVYLTRYAEEQQDLALLSISTFQRALKDPNQLIRASALRVLSSIRVPVIVPIMMLAIKEAVMDMSPYVRKTAAHAIPKLYNLDPEQKDQLIEVIEKLLADKTVLVAGSAIQAFEEVCPDRIDLIHKHYRKLCSLLVDVEEWGQVVIINMLTRYVRCQFIDPNRTEMPSSEKFYDDEDEDAEKDDEEENSDSDAEDEDGEEGKAKRNGRAKRKDGGRTTKVKPYVMDSDHRLLLRTCKPLLNSRNSAVMMGVVQLYYHCAPDSEVAIAIKPMVRLLRSHKEIQFVVLSNIASMSTVRPTLFDAYLKSFYVRSNDPTHIKLLKLEILTNLATETSISTILREFQNTYVTSPDKAFAAATIQAIGRCASNIPEITDTCLNGLVSLLSKKDETVVAESVVVIKKLLQMQSSDHKDIIVHMARLADAIQVPMARASILWLIGEYCDRIPKIAPDVLRKMAKVFINEEDIVKLQILNLAGKLCITNSKQTKLLTQYVFNLAKYDQNYDIRDRSRFLRALILPSDGNAGGYLAKHAKKILLATKPAPLLESNFKARPNYQIASLSHLLNKQAVGYHPLPEWPEVAPDPSQREVPPETPSWEQPPAGGIFGSLPLSSKRSSGAKKKGFYSSSEESESESESEESGSEEVSGSEEEGSSEEEEEEEEEDSEEESDESSSDDEELKRRKKSETLASKAARYKESSHLKRNMRNEEESSAEEESSSELEDSSSQSGSDEDESSSEEEAPPPPPPPPPASKKAKSGKKGGKAAEAKPSADLLLLDFGDEPTPSAPIAPPLLPSSSSLLTPTAARTDAPAPVEVASSAAPANPMEMPPVAVSGKTFELVNRYAANGLRISYRFPRSISVFSPRLVNVELQAVNESDQPIEKIRAMKKPSVSNELQEFPEIAALPPHGTTSVLISVDFRDSSQPVPFLLCVGADRKLDVAVKAPVGELVRPVTMTEREFATKRGKLSGMNEHTAQLDLTGKKVDNRALVTCVLQTANLLAVSSPPSETLSQRFAGRSVANESPVLVSLDGPLPSLRLCINCESMTIGSMLLKELKEAIGRTF